MKSPAFVIRFLILGCLSVSATGAAQLPLNFDFEKMSVEGTARPWGWSPFQQAPHTTIALDSTTVYEGVYSLLCSDDEAGDDGSGGAQTLGYWLSPYELQGKKITLTAQVKTQKTGGFAQLSLGAYGDSGLIKEVRSPEFRGISDWQPVQLVFENSAPAHSWFLILTSSGSGKVWFDNIRLFADGRKLKQVEVAPAITVKQLKRLKKYSTTLAGCSPQPPGATTDPSDFEAFRRAAGDAKIIALGESTHGTSEFFQMKHRLLQYAVQELDVRVFAIEANQLEVEKINNYVLHGAGLSDQVIRVMFRVWNTAEMLALIEWLRGYNAGHPDRTVAFVGFDLQDPGLPMDSLSAFVADRAPAWKPVVDSLQTDYRAAWRNRYYPQAADSIRARWKANAAKVLDIATAQYATWLDGARTDTEKNRVEWALQNARVVYQAADIAFSQSVSARDTFMAENIRWLRSRYDPESRMIVWAHDSHIARGDSPDDRYNYHGGNSMGKYLSQMYGEDYRAFALFTYSGRYSATISFTNHRIVPVEAMTAPRGSLDEALHRIAVERGTGHLFLDLRQAGADPGVRPWLEAPRPVRFVGYATSDFDFGALMSIPNQFDGIFFMDKTRPSVLLR